MLSEQQAYSLADLKRLFHVSAPLVRALARSGYISAANEEAHGSYGFEDMLILRIAAALKAARIADKKAIAAIGAMRASLTPGAVLTTLALQARAGHREGTAPLSQWQARSEARAGAASRSKPAAPARRSEHAAAPTEADRHYARAQALEETDLPAARAAYLDALRADEHHLEARINLGRLLHMAGELERAEKVYRRAKHASATLSFNLAVLLEDLQREEEAVTHYRKALALAPDLHHAHYNLSLLHDRLGRQADALRHMLAYRRHARYVGE